jgi:hypothetical protein
MIYRVSGADAIGASLRRAMHQIGVQSSTLGWHGLCVRPRRFKTASKKGM